MMMDPLKKTYIINDNIPGLLHRQIRSLVVPTNSRLSNVKVFSSLEGKLALNIFFFEPTKSVKTTASNNDAQNIFQYINDTDINKFILDSSIPINKDFITEESISQYLKKCTPTFVINTDPRRFLILRQLYENVKGTESTSIHIEPDFTNAGGSWISIASANALPEVLLRLSSAMISHRKLDISRAHLDTVKDEENEMGPDMPGYVTILRLLVSDPKNPGQALDSNSNEIISLLKDLKRSKWLDDEVTELGLVKFPNLGVEKAEITVSYISLLHGPLAKINSQAYASIKSIIQIISSNNSHIQLIESICDLFIDRFNPKLNPTLSADSFNTRYNNIKNKIDRIANETIKIVLLKFLDAVKLTLRTNFFLEDRYALGIKIHPSVMATGNIGQPDGRPLPFGVLFAHARHFNGFHCRFRDIARGGLRIVTPQNSDQYALESTRQFDEAYGLSFAQQLKNKDIPEGGSKAVILVNSPAIAEQSRFFSSRKCVKSFTNTILDLIVSDSVKQLVDLYGKDELIYLGPDEQIIPFDIDWICNRAAQRGYPIPAAFMSSKKGAGINHKEYGVTSEGIVVYADVALRKVLNIDPTKQPFTIKITGGPDGDVAGNLLKILFRDYGSNCKVVAIADGSGVAEDPNGLDSTELLRLFHEALPILHFNKTKLSNDGILYDANTDEGSTRRNTMPFRIKSDLFVPAGGRPNTINVDNWKQFLDPETGIPTSPLIVEGANIFITAEARELLFKHANVKIVKDSSANKCGVITSSCEVAASMLLSRDEFLQIKDKLIADVIIKLKHLAKLEAELLFREFSNYPGALPHFSDRISYAIAKVTDAMTDKLNDISINDSLFIELYPLIIDNLPKALADYASDRVPNRFPIQYQKNAIASTLASYLVYKEGIHFIESQPIKLIADRAILYYKEDKEIQELSKSLISLNTDKQIDIEKIVKILNKGGARTSLDIF